MEVYAGDKLVKRFLTIDTLSTAVGTQDSMPRAYRFSYGVLNANLNGSDYSTSYIFYENSA